MTWLRRLGWGALAAATLALAAAVYLVSLPEPENVIVLDRAAYVFGSGNARDVGLPHTANRSIGERPESARYLVRFDLATLPAEPLLLFISAVNRRLSLMLNGEPLFDSNIRALWSGPMVRNSTLVHLPHATLRAGRNELTVTLEAEQTAIPSHLSRMYIGDETVLLPKFRLRAFVEDRLKTMAFAAHVLVGIGLLLAYFYRPNDSLFSWLAATTVLSFLLSIALVTDFPPYSETIRQYAVALYSVVGFLNIGIACSLVGIRPPQTLRLMTVLVPGISALAVLGGILADRVIVLINMPILLAAIGAAAGIVAWGAFQRSGTEARLMLAPFFLIFWFLVRDVGVITGLLEGSLLLTPYVRPVVVAAFMALLMRRLAMSLDGLDRANETLHRRLAEREAQLAALHREERIESARQVRDQERQRLTRDLHDGISGHLVSIIAMSEQPDGGVKAIEQAARAALDDLRLVIYSLDLGDRELPLALANFRERLIPQLQRIGVELDWSTANLPEVSGVTPGNALVIMRILQEAITNALKHGPARRISVRGASMPDGAAVITIENDGSPFTAGKTGLGLENMRRRARQLHGELEIESLECGARLTLRLPACLPDFQDATAG